MVDEGSTLDMGNNDVVVQEEMNDTYFGRADGDEAPFVAYIADICSFVSSKVGHLTVSFLLEIIHVSSFDLGVFKKPVRSCNDGREIAHCAVARCLLGIGYREH